MLGVDIVEIGRMEEMENFEGFLNKVFSEEERAYIRAREPFRTAAGMWAAKEAVAKAAGTGFCAGLSPRAVEIGHTPEGAPFARAGGAEYELSVSHERHYAVAVAMRRAER